jgi:hypothetical protein
VNKAISDLVKKPVGTEGTFAHLVFSHDLVHLIGGGNDTNANTTRRCLLLLESVPLGRPEAYERVVHSVLKRYLLGDRSFTGHIGPCHVPRVLLNDFARYWWTMAVDFAYKYRERQAKGAALRNLKLRFSRKLLYVAGLIACFSCKLKLGRPDCARDKTVDPEECVICTRALMRRAPLEILAMLFLQLLDRPDRDREAIAATARRVFDAYDGFVAMLAEHGRRRDLSEGPDPQSWVQGRRARALLRSR